MKYDSAEGYINIQKSLKFIKYDTNRAVVVFGVFWPDKTCGCCKYVFLVSLCNIFRYDTTWYIKYLKKKTP